MIILSQHLFPSNSESPTPKFRILGTNEKFFFGADALTPSPQKKLAPSLSQR